MGYLALFPLLGHVAVLVFFALVLMYTVRSIMHTFRLYRRIPPHVPAEHDLLKVLREQAEATSAWMKLHQRTGLIMYPLAVT